MEIKTPYRIPSVFEMVAWNGVGYTTSPSAAIFGALYVLLSPTTRTSLAKAYP